MEVDDQSKDEIDEQPNEDERSQLDDEYAVQYFGFLPQFFMNGIYNMMCEYLKEATSALNESILNKFKNHVTENHIQEVSKELRIKAIQRLDTKFDKAEYYFINNIFKLPEHVVLPEDKAQIDSPCSEEEMAQLDEDIETTVKRINMVKMANAIIRTRIEKIDTLQKDFDSTMVSVNSIHSEVNTQSGKVLQSVTDLGNVQKELLKLEIN